MKPETKIKEKDKEIFWIFDGRANTLHARKEIKKHGGRWNPIYGYWWIKTVVNSDDYNSLVYIGFKLQPAGKDFKEKDIPDDNNWKDKNFWIRKEMQEKIMEKRKKKRIKKNKNKKKIFK